jgi:hypothetical protein
LDYRVVHLVHVIFTICFFLSFVKEGGRLQINKHYPGQINVMKQER